MALCKFLSLWFELSYHRVWVDQIPKCPSVIMSLSEGQTLTGWRFPVSLLNVLDKHFTHPAFEFSVLYLHWTTFELEWSWQEPFEGDGNGDWWTAFKTEAGPWKGKKLVVLSLFDGIGGIWAALTRLGIPFVGYSSEVVRLCAFWNDEEDDFHL